MDSIRARLWSGGLIACFALVAVAGPAMGQDEVTNDAENSVENPATKTGWDQEAVTKLAAELEEALRDAYKRSSKSSPQATVLQQREREAAESVLRRARNLSEEYARRMRSGWDRDASEPYFRAVAEEVAHVRDTAGKAVPAPDEQPYFDRVRAVLDELRAHYDSP